MAAATTAARAAAAPAAGSTSTAAQPAGKKIKVGLVTDIGGLNDRSFNALANKGLEDAKSQLGIEGRVLISKSNADYVPNLTTLAQQKYDLVIAVGFLMADATEKVAEQVPEREVRDHRLVRGGHEEQAQERRGPAVLRAGGRLPRRLPVRACTPRTTTSRPIGSVGGQKIPPVDHYIAGFQAGAKKADP